MSGTLTVTVIAHLPLWLQQKFLMFLKKLWLQYSYDTVQSVAHSYKRNHIKMTPDKVQNLLTFQQHVQLQSSI